MADHPRVESFYDPATNTVTHVVIEPAGKHASAPGLISQLTSARACAIIDSVLDYEISSGRTNTKSADKVAAFITENQLSVQWILETHVHADHLTAAKYLQKRLGGRTGVGAHIKDVQVAAKSLFNLGESFNPDGHHFDHLFADGETVSIGSISGRVIFTPGHTPACCTYVFGDSCFVGDTLFMPDSGTARCDFPGGGADILYRSIQKTLSLPPETRMFICHDYQPGGRQPKWETTVAEQREKNIHVGAGKTEAEFIALRYAGYCTLFSLSATHVRSTASYDTGLRTLGTPQLLLPSVQVNVRGGEFPPAESNGVAYLKVPLNQKLCAAHY